MAAPPQRFKSTGGCATLVPKEEPEEPSMADALLKADPQIISKLKAEDAPICTDSKEMFAKLINDDPALQGIQVEPMGDSSTINSQLQNIDVEQIGDPDNINPGNFTLHCTLNLYLMIILLDYFLSGPFSESMKISDNQQKVSSRNFQRQSSELETPDISMEQSKSKTTLNNLG